MSAIICEAASYFLQTFWRFLSSPQGLSVTILYTIKQSTFSIEYSFNIQFSSCRNNGLGAIMGGFQFSEVAVSMRFFFCYYTNKTISNVFYLDVP